MLAHVTIINSAGKAEFSGPKRTSDMNGIVQKALRNGHQVTVNLPGFKIEKPKAEKKTAAKATASKAATR